MDFIFWTVQSLRPVHLCVMPRFTRTRCEAIQILTFQFLFCIVDNNTLARYTYMGYVHNFEHHLIVPCIQRSDECLIGFDCLSLTFQMPCLFHRNVLRLVLLPVVTCMHIWFIFLVGRNNLFK
jgi:hypothetical protein